MDGVVLYIGNGTFENEVGTFKVVFTGKHKGLNSFIAYVTANGETVTGWYVLRVLEKKCLVTINFTLKGVMKKEPFEFNDIDELREKIAVFHLSY